MSEQRARRPSRTRRTWRAGRPVVAAAAAVLLTAARPRRRPDLRRPGRPPLTRTSPHPSRPAPHSAPTAQPLTVEPVAAFDVPTPESSPTPTPTSSDAATPPPAAPSPTSDGAVPPDPAPTSAPEPAPSPSPSDAGPGPLPGTRDHHGHPVLRPDRRTGGPRPGRRAGDSTDLPAAPERPSPTCCPTRPSASSSSSPTAVRTTSWPPRAWSTGWPARARTESSPTPRRRVLPLHAAQEWLPAKVGTRLAPEATTTAADDARLPAPTGLAPRPRTPLERSRHRGRVSPSPGHTVTEQEFTVALSVDARLPHHVRGPRHRRRARARRPHRGAGDRRGPAAHPAEPRPAPGGRRRRTRRHRLHAAGLPAGVPVVGRSPRARRARRCSPPPRRRRRS